jgi:hypothetical protein
LAFDIDSSEGGLFAIFEDRAGFASSEANAAVVLALDEVCSTMVADELYTVARPSIGVFVFALEGKPVDNGVKADFWFISVMSWLAHVHKECGRDLNLRFANSRQCSEALTRDNHVQEVSAQVWCCLEESEELDVVPARESSAHLQCM